MKLWVVRWKHLLRKKGEGECYDRFGIGKFEECILVVI